MALSAARCGRVPLPTLQQKSVVAHEAQEAHTECTHAAFPRARLQHLQASLQQFKLAPKSQEHLPSERQEH